MKVGLFEVDTSSDEIRFALVATYSLDASGVVECSGDPIIMQNFIHDPRLFRLDDIEHGHPLLPEDGITYLKALISEQRASYSHFEELADP